MIEMMITIDGHICFVSDTNICIKNSYEIADKDIDSFIDHLSEAVKEKHFKRSKKSWKKELLSHNRLFRLGLFVEHTIDTDLSDNESKLRLFAYNILSLKIPSRE